MADNSRKSQDSGSVNHKDTKNHAFDAAALLELVSKYKRYIGAGALFLLMVVVLVKFTGPVTTDTPSEPDSAVTADLAEEFQVDAYPQINELITSYYQAYAAGDVTSLEEIATPLSDTEKSYIQVFSEYVEDYENLSCYTKSGLVEGEYVVSVYLEMKLKDVTTLAPGLDFFYLRTDDNGKLYIDNAYSQFNQSNMEASTQADVQALINDFEQADDVVALQTEVQAKYDEAVSSDAKLDEMANQTIPDAIAVWVESLTQTADTGEDTTDETQTDDAENAESQDADSSDAKDTADEGTDSEEKTTEKSNGKAKTAYAMEAVNIRKGPSTDKKVVTQVPLGGELKIYPSTEKDGWVKASYDGKKGYVKREYVTTKRSKVPEVTATTQESSTTVSSLPEGKEVTLSDSVNVRVSMSETSDRVGLAFQGDVVKVIQSYAEGWTKVEWNGQTGYIKTDLIK